MSLTDEGYTAPRAADFLTTIRTAIGEALDDAGLPSDVDYDRDTVFGIITAVLAARLGAAFEPTQGVYDLVDPNNATGLALDVVGAFRGIDRNLATYSTATVTLTGTVGTFIPEGTLVEGGGPNGDSRWATTEDATVGGGGTVAVIVQAEDLGAVTAEIAEIDAIVTPVSGWTAVSNAAAATTGDARETDAEYRARMLGSGATAGAGTLGSLRAKLLDLDYLDSAVVLENETNASTTVDGVTIDAMAIAVILSPSTITTAQREEVAELIYTNRGGPVKTMGTDIVATVTGADGYAKTVRWDWADDLTVNVAVVVTLEDGFVIGDVEPGAEAAIVTYFDTLTVGSPVRRLKIQQALAGIEGIAGVTTLTLNSVAADVEPTLVQLPVLGTNAVT